MTDEATISETNIDSVVENILGGKKNVIKRLERNRFIRDSHWIWTGSKMFDGRGQVRIKNKLYLVPRLSLFAYKDFDLNSNLKALHIPEVCNIPACFNPEHLYVGTQQQNIIDSYRNYTKKTHCLKGHEFTPEKTKRNISGAKICKICNREYSRKYRQSHAR